MIYELWRKVKVFYFKAGLLLIICKVDESKFLLSIIVIITLVLHKEGLNILGVSF